MAKWYIHSGSSHLIGSPSPAPPAPPVEGGWAAKMLFLGSLFLQGSLIFLLHCTFVFVFKWCLDLPEAVTTFQPLLQTLKVTLGAEEVERGQSCVSVEKRPRPRVSKYMSWRELLHTSCLHQGASWC